jgi:hypothetical protein
MLVEMATSRRFFMSDKTVNDANVVNPGESPAEYFGNVRALGDLMRGDSSRRWLTSLPQEIFPRRLVVWLGCNILRTAHMAETLTRAADREARDGLNERSSADANGAKYLESYS